MNILYKNLTDYKKGFDSKIFGELIPREILDKYRKEHPGKYRDRAFGFIETLYGMLMQATLEDKSEAQAVLLLSAYHDLRTKAIEEKENNIRENESTTTIKKVGRPRKSYIKIQKSKLRSISLNAASFNESKKRFPKELLDLVYQHTTKNEYFASREIPTWHGHRVMIADGTSFKTVDTKDLREYFIPNIPNNPPPLPIGRIEGLIDYYGGFVADIRITDYQTGELRALKEMHESITEGALLLADDLYGTFGHFAYCQQRSVELIVQLKHYHTETIIRQINKNDNIVRWRKSSKSIWYSDTAKEPDSIELRKISITNPGKPSEMMHFYTTLIDEKKYACEDIAALFLCRWDIELSFREIKDAMKLEFTRGKSVEGVKKEIMSHIIAYNIMRRLMQNVFQQTGEDFFSLGKTIQKNDQNVSHGTEYVDRLGRSYSKKSTGRYPKGVVEIPQEEKSRKTRAKSR